MDQGLPPVLLLEAAVNISHPALAYIPEGGGRPLVTYTLCKARSALRYWDTFEYSLIGVSKAAFC